LGRLANTTCQDRLPVLRRLEETTHRKTDGETRKRDCRGYGLEDCLGTQALIDREPNEPVTFAERGEGLHRLIALGLDALQQDIDALIDKRELHLGNSLGLQDRGEQAA